MNLISLFCYAFFRNYAQDHYLWRRRWNNLTEANKRKLELELPEDILFEIKHGCINTDHQCWKLLSCKNYLLILCTFKNLATDFYDRCGFEYTPYYNNLWSKQELIETMRPVFLNAGLNSNTQINRSLVTIKRLIHCYIRNYNKAPMPFNVFLAHLCEPPFYNCDYCCGYLWASGDSYRTVRLKLNNFITCLNQLCGLSPDSIVKRHLKVGIKYKPPTIF